MNRRVIFVDPDIWTQPKENHMTDNAWTHVGGDLIRATPDADGITTLYYPEGDSTDRRLGVAIAFTDDKLGRFWIPLVGDDLLTLHHLLDALLKLNPEQMHQLIDQVHTGPEDTR